MKQVKKREDMLGKDFCKKRNKAKEHKITNVIDTTTKIFLLSIFSLVFFVSFSSCEILKSVQANVGTETTPVSQKSILLEIDQNIEKPKEEYITDSFYMDYIYVEGTMTKETADYVYTLMKKIPKDILKEMTDAGWKITLCNRPIVSSEDEIYVLGYTNADEKMVYLTKDRKEINEAFYHEIGHVFDALNDFYSNTEEFQKIYEKEKEKFEYSKSQDKEYARKNASEYFACAFDDIINNNFDTKQCKNTYISIIKKISAINNEE